MALPRLASRNGQQAIAAWALLLSSCAKHYPVEGLVLRVDRPQRTILVSHHEVRGYMPAMAMPFRVKDASELRDVAPGSRITFDLVVGRRGAVARRVRSQSLVPEGIVENNGEKLRLPTARAKLPIGAPVPDFTLTDQLSRPVHLSDFRGRVVALNFIYTRCPLPEVCPRLSDGFARLQRRFVGRDLVLLSVTLDPQYDTPEVLSLYGKVWKANATNWRFLTGDLTEIRRIGDLLGLIWWPEEGVLIHTSQTGVIGRDGKLVALVEGSSYSADQLGDLIALELEVD